MKVKLRQEVVESGQMRSNDLSLFHYGYEECCSDTYWGPGVKDHFKIHLVVSGKGYYKYKGATYEVTEGMAFLTEPDVLAQYYADSRTPWAYDWVAFGGSRVEEILENTGFIGSCPVVKVDPTVLDEINDQCQKLLRMNNRKIEKELLEMSFLYDFLSRFIEGDSKVKQEGEKGVKAVYVEQAKSYVESNYSRQISCSTIADHIGIHRKYLTKVFREISHVTPQQYLIAYRIQRAKRYLKDTSLSVSEVANSVGYLDPLTFSKTFRRVAGMSPTQYRNEKE